MKMKRVACLLLCVLLPAAAGCGLVLHGQYMPGDGEAEPDVDDMRDGADVDQMPDRPDVPGDGELPEMVEIIDGVAADDAVEPADIVEAFTDPDILQDPDLSDPDLPEPVEEEVLCPADCSGHGVCSAGACLCNGEYAGPACDRCADNYTGYPACAHCSAPGELCCDGGICIPGYVCFAGLCMTACPAGMTRIGVNLCIDSYEASRSGSAAQSAPGVMPWVNIDRSGAGNACAAAGKRLCTIAEWQLGCMGPSGTTYPYGPSFVAGACNDRNGSCAGGEGVAATGSFASCQGGFPGVFDMSGNVWEWIEEADDVNSGAFGGSVDCCRDPTKLACGSGGWIHRDTTWPALGFRCCL